MPPVNDNLSNARVITTNVSYTNETTIGATVEGDINTVGTEAYDMDGHGPSVWYRLEWGATGRWRVHVNNANWQWGTISYIITGSDPPAYSDLTQGENLGFQQFYPPSEVWMLSNEHSAGYVVYIRFSSTQPNYYNFTGDFNISFEFVPSPYNSGTTPPNATWTTPTLLNIPNSPVAGTTVGASDPIGDVWYRLEPASDVTIGITISKTGSTPWTPYADIYKIVGSDPPTSWNDLDSTYTGWIGEYKGTLTTQVSGGVKLEGGSVYLIDVYDASLVFNDTFTIEIVTGVAPPNDDVANATVVATGKQTITGSTNWGTEEVWEIDNWDSSGTPSVWYRIDVGGPGMLSVQIDSLTAGWDAELTTWYKTGDPTGTVTDMSQLTQEASYARIDTSPLSVNPKNYYVYFDPNHPTRYALYPLKGGEQLYLRVSSYNAIGKSDAGSFKLTIYNPPAQICLAASDYAASNAYTSIVAGSVRTTQPYTETYSNPEGSMIGDAFPTLTIPGSAITNSSGFFAVQIETKNSTAYNWLGSLRRNGQPLWPGSIPDTSDTSTPIKGWLTAPAGFDVTPDDNVRRECMLNMVGWIAVEPTDTIEVIVNTPTNTTPQSIDISKVCFQRCYGAREQPPYDIINIPDYPLGMSSSDIGTNDQQGDLIIYKNTAPTYTNHRYWGMDICTTDDGTVWVIANWQTATGSSGNWIGPTLQKWNGSSWTIVRDDVEGLGVKGTRLGGVPLGLSIDTDGTDLWMCYGVDEGVGVQGGRNSAIRVKKYVPATDTLSNVGGTIKGTNTNNLTYQTGGYDDTAVIRVSPNGVPWVSFTDYMGSSSIARAGWAAPAFVARWTGSTWDVQALPVPVNAYWDWDSDGVAYTYQAKDYRYASGTTSEVVHAGELCIRETQTTAAADTMRFTPPAGNWGFEFKVACTKPTFSSGTVILNIYKNGTLFYSGVNGQMSSATDGSPWRNSNWTRFYTSCSGSDEIEVRAYCQGTATEAFIDEIYITKAAYCATWVGEGPYNVKYVHESQPHVGLFMHRVGETGFGENPGALYNYVCVRYIDDPTAEGYVPPGADPTNYAVSWRGWVYCEWNGSSWEKKWDRLIEEDAPDHILVKTLSPDAPASVPPYGHYQQGFGFTTDGVDNYMTASLGGGQAFGFFGDSIVCLKIGPSGFIPFTKGAPNVLGGAGYPQGVIFGLSGFSGYAYYTGARSVVVDERGNVWLAWAIADPNVGLQTFIGHAVPNDDSSVGWLSASLTNEEIGEDSIDVSQPFLALSPDGSTVYMLANSYIHYNGPYPAVSPYTMGVWECPRVENAKIPMSIVITGAVDLSRIKLRAYQRGDLAQ